MHDVNMYSNSYMDIMRVCKGLCTYNVIHKLVQTRLTIVTRFSNSITTITTFCLITCTLYYSNCVQDRES